MENGDKVENNPLSEEFADQYSYSNDSITLHNDNEPKTDASVSQRVFHAAKEGLAVSLYALLADQARPQQVHSLINRGVVIFIHII